MKAMLRKPLALSIITLLIVGGGLAAWGYASGMNPSDRYKLQTLEAGPLTQNVSANGTLNPVILVNVGTQVSGTVKQLHVDFNDKVAKGQALAELDNTVLAAQARQSAANLQSALASQELALANEARMSALFAKEYVSKQEHDQAMQARKAAAAAVDLAQAQADKDRANLSYTVIRSPVAGVVVARSVDIGQTVAASFQTPTLFQIAQDLAQMQIDTSFPEADIGNIKVAMDVRFTVDAFPGRSFTGKVRQIRFNPTTQQNVVTYNVVVAVDNPDQVLMPGMTAYVNIGVSKRKEVLMAPNAALRFKPSEAAAKPDAKAGGDSKTGKKKKEADAGTVYVLRDGQVQPVAVTLGISDNRNTEIVSGEIKAGEQVIVGEATVAAPGKTSTVGVRMF
jgi:HlyD family secretion protein